MGSLLVRWGVTIIAVFIASKIVPNQINYDNWVGLALFAAVLGLLNAVVKPILTLLALPFVILTLGLALLVINALVFLLAGNIVSGFYVNGFIGALIGSIIVSIVGWLLSIFLPK